MKDGIGRAPEIEEEVSADVARAFVSQPDMMLQHKSDILGNLRQTYGISNLMCLGGFKNLRKLYSWGGLKLEVDQTMYDWGTLYEIECETVEPERARGKLEEFLNRHNIPFQWTSSSKFANFINKSLL